jgi:flagellar hook-basal body complex protein FliE
VPDPIAIHGIVPPIVAQPAPGSPAAAPAGKSFQSVLLESLDEVNRLQAEADQGVERLMTGQTGNVAEVLSAVNKAGIAFDLLMEIRNKLVESYKEIEQMQV